MLFSDKCNHNQVNWNYMVRNRCQCNILQIFEESYYMFIFYLPICLCFDLMILSKINQVIWVAILIFLDLRSVLQMIFFVTFYFLKFFFDHTILVLDGYYFQTSKIITKPIGIIWQKRCQDNVLQIFGEIVTFSSFVCFITSGFFCCCFQVTM